MRLFELEEFNKKLQSYLNDFLIPLKDKGIKTVNLKNIALHLRKAGVQVRLDRGFLLNILDPSVNPLISEIRGDDVFLNIPENISRVVGDDQEKTEKEKMSDTAKKQAQDNLS